MAAGDNYFLYNIASGMFLTDGMDYGTHASVDHAGRVITLATNTNGYSIYTRPYSANGTAEKAGYLTLNGYVDTGTNDADWVFTPVSVDGYTNAYTIKHSDTEYLYYEVKDGLYQSKMGAFVNVGNSTEDAKSYWLLIPMSARQTANDYTYLLRNTDFHHPWELPMWSNTVGWTNIAGGLKENVCAEMYGKGFDISQTISTTVANGKYKLYNQAFYNNADASNQTYLYANDNQSAIAILNANEEGTAANMPGASTAFTAGQYVNSVTAIVTDGSLKVGIKNATTAGNAWTIMDNFYLEYYGTCVVNDAIALPDGGAMAADTWYYYNLPSSYYYDFTSSDGTTLTYTSDGTQLVSEATGTASTFTAFETKEISLPAGRVYFKTDAPTTLTISYKYKVGSATADASCIQTGKTVTVSYASLGTSDPSASPSKDFSGVTFNGASISVTPTANGFTFVVPTVTTNTSYTLSIPANAIGYADADIYNAAQNIEFNTPVLPDGTYYFRAAATYDGTNEGTSAAVGKYLSRGTAYSTHTSLDSYGLPVVITNDNNGVTTLKMADTNAYIFSPTNSNWDSYTDGAASEQIGFTITLLNGKYLISSNYRSNSGTSKYLKYNNANVNDEEISVFDDGTGANAGPIIMWAIESISEHATAMQAKKDNQATAAAAAAYASGNYESLNGITTVTALESELTANYIEGAFVSPTTISSVEESYQPRNNSSGNLVPVTVYSNTIEITAAGFYKFSMQAFNRATWNGNVQELHEAGADMPAAVLFFGDSETQIKSLYDEVGHDAAVEGANPADVSYNGKYYANCKASALKMFKDDKYHNDVWFYCSTPGTYTYGVKIMGYAAGQWFIYSPESVTITSYAAAASTEDYTALTNAIKAYDAATLGFQAGEYAPYNNVLAINNIDAAKAIDPSATNSKLLVNSLTSYLSLTANAAEVNAIYNPTFALSDNDGAMAGWRTSSSVGLGGAQHARAFVLTSGMTNYDNLAAFGQGDGTRSCAYLRFDGTNSGKDAVYTYGATAGYTLPLKAKAYRLTAQLGGWGQVDKDITIQVVNSSDVVVATKTLHTPSTGIHAGGSAIDLDLLVNVLAAGDYKIQIKNTDTSVDNAIAISNFELKLVPESDVTLAVKANKFGTFIAPFDVEIPAGVEAYSVATVTANVLDLTPIATTIPANTPVILKNTTASLISKVVSGQSLAEADSYTVGLLTGVYTAAAIPVSEGTTTNYVLQTDGDTQAFYVVNGAFTATPNRCYLTVTTGGATKARVLYFDEATAIENLTPALSESEGVIYNLNGQRVNTLQKGINIVNGKKVLVK